MTETYNGYWSPVKGDCKEVKQDPYHSYPVSKKAGVVNEPAYEAGKTAEASAVQSAGTGG